MSHFLTYVFVKNPAEAEAEVDRLLAPYDENIEVAPYERSCYCVGRTAREESNKAADDSFGSLDALMDSFSSHSTVRRIHAEIKGIRSSMSKSSANFDDKTITETPIETDNEATARLSHLEEELGGLWSEAISDRQKAEKAAFEAHPKRFSADDDCSDCGGTGKVISNYNPKSKWDWYVIGGRWDGVIQGVERSSQNGFNFSSEHHNMGNNSRLASDLLAAGAILRKLVPHAVVLPNGEWRQSAEMGWFGITTNDVDPKLWERLFAEFLADYNDHLVVAVDCHI